VDFVLVSGAEQRKHIIKNQKVTIEEWASVYTKE
jgi:hypothetical protein